MPARLPPFPRTDEARRLQIYYIGQLYPWKGVDTLLEAMQELPDQELVIVGGLPPEPDLAHHQGLAQKLGVADRVCFRGYLPPPNSMRSDSKQTSSSSRFTTRSWLDTSLHRSSSSRPWRRDDRSWRPIYRRSERCSRTVSMHCSSPLTIPTPWPRPSGSWIAMKIYGSGSHGRPETKSGSIRGTNGPERSSGFSRRLAANRGSPLDSLEADPIDGEERLAPDSFTGSKLQ